MKFLTLFLLLIKMQIKKDNAKNTTQLCTYIINHNESIFQVEFKICFFFLQILFISGLGCIMGPWRTFNFFFQRQKYKGTAAFFIGVFVVLFGWPLVGMIIELYGFFVLFRHAKFKNTKTKKKTSRMF